MGGDVGIAQRSELLPVERLHAIQEAASRLAAQSRRVGHVKDRVALAAELHPLKVAGKKTVAPVPGLEGLTAAAAGEHHKRRQILIVRPQAISQPRAHGGPTWLLVARSEK